METVLLVQTGSSTQPPPPPPGDSGTINKLEEELEKANEKITKLEKVTKQLEDLLNADARIDQPNIVEVEERVHKLEKKTAALTPTTTWNLQCMISKLEQSVKENTKQTTATTLDLPV